MSPKIKWYMILHTWWMTSQILARREILINVLTLTLCIMPEACVRSAIRLRAGRRRPRSASTPTDSTTQEVCAINATAAGTTTRSEIPKN